jgi:hypothetical protein
VLAPLRPFALQTTEVDVDHAVVLHKATPRLCETVRSLDQKFRPSTVSDGPPLIAIFGVLLAVTAGASKVNSMLPVPTTEDMVMPTFFITPYPVRPLQLTDVLELHVEVPHKALDMVTDIVKSVIAKFKPDTVTYDPAVEGALASIKPVITGPLNVNCCRSVPSTAATVKATEIE